VQEISDTEEVNGSNPVTPTINVPGQRDFSTVDVRLALALFDLSANSSACCFGVRIESWLMARARV